MFRFHSRWIVGGELIEYRCFRNADPPQLLRLWNEANLGRGAARGFSGTAFEILVFSHVFFDREGLIVAVEHGRIIGFVHAGFGCDPEEKQLSFTDGVICAIAVHPSHRRRGIGRELLARAENYLKAKGATSIQAGGSYPRDPFYVGIYGGSLLPGFLQSDKDAAPFLQKFGYAPSAEFVICQRDLGFRNESFDYRSMMIRRTAQLVVNEGPAKLTWWWVSRFGAFDFIRFSLQSKSQNKTLAEVFCHSMDLFARSGDQRVVALTGLQVPPEEQGKGYAKTLILEVFRRLREEAVTRIEMQAPITSAATIHMLKTLNCEEIDHGTVYLKPSL